MRRLAISLYCVRMEQDIVSGRDFTDFLVMGWTVPISFIGKHDGNQDSVRPDGFFQLVQLYYTIFVHIYIEVISQPFFSRYSQVWRMA